MKKPVAGALLLLLSVAVSLLLLEGAARVLNSILELKHGQVSPGIAGNAALEYPTLFMKDSDLFWRMAPATEETNSEGFRDRDFSPDKETGVFRVVCMGDSITFGWPVPIDETYPNMLEYLLAERFKDKKIEVINAGVPGYTSFQGLMQLEKKILGYSPDLIIVYYGVNDRAGAYRQDKDVIRAPRWFADLENLVYRFQCYKLLNRVALRLRYPPDNVMGVSRVSPYNYHRNLKLMIECAAERGIGILLVVHPAFYDRRTGEVFTDTRYVPPRQGWQFDIYSFFKDRTPHAGVCFLDDTRPYNFHLTREGQRILSEGVFDCLTQNEALVARLSGGTDAPGEEL
ncbi:MAG: GDSL-type esterase/lipase family protein [Candidatus Omnitrophica bacterium]|nr:GDSL-type esterase/lipase family protein [Candidatus Omnitrophota bacterium]